MRYDITQLTERYCFGCVLYPPNLPPYAYSEEDWAMLQALPCSLEHTPGSSGCQASRKTSCSLVELAPAPCAGEAAAVRCGSRHVRPGD